MKKLSEKIGQMIRSHKKESAAAAIILILLTAALYFGCRYFINRSFLNTYQAEKYEDLNPEALMIMNWYEAFLPYYNAGNAAYQNGEYEEAERFYRAALKQNPPHKSEDDRECDIRINLALSILHQIQFDNLDNEAQINRAIDLCMLARLALTETDCANREDSTGHNEDAEQLKKEIDEFLKKLQNNQDENAGGGSDENEDQNQGQNEKDQDQNQGDESEDDDSSFGGKTEQSIRDQIEKERQTAFDMMREEQQHQKQVLNSDNFEDYLNAALGGDNGENEGETDKGPDYYW